MSEESFEDFIRRGYARFNQAEREPVDDQELAMEMAHVNTVEDGKLRSIEEYQERADGLQTVGLPE
jgi:hypothetical protein